MAADVQVPRSITVPDLLQGEWSSVVVLTYGANLAFLESRLLGQLAQIPLRVVLADHSRLAARLQEAADTGQRLRNANRTYLTGPVRHSRAAHAKAILLTGATEGLLVVGSGNLSQDGYASPGEVWHVFAYTDQRRQHLPEFVTVRGLIDGLAKRGALDPPTSQMLKAAWSGAAWLPESTEMQGSVQHNLDVSLIDQLAAKVPWKVNRMTVYAPFHDPDCAALSGLIERFKPRRLRVLIARDTSVDADRLIAVLSKTPQSQCLQVKVRDDPGIYLHAKWVHLEGAKQEALLTGSANLSRSALLSPAALGNVELGVISLGVRKAYDHLYAPLDLTAIENLHELGVKFNSEPEPPQDSTGPILLWSQLDGTTLTLMFDRPVKPKVPLTLAGPEGTFTVTRIRAAGTALVVSLRPDDAVVLAEGGPIRVSLDGEESESAVTWPYHLDLLLGRLERATNRDLLPQIGTLPDGDAELFGLLQQLEATLIFDPVSAWRVAKPEVRDDSNNTDEPSLGWEELDWDRIRRDPRYGAYQFRGRGHSSAPTDIEVILAAISGKLGELGPSLSSKTVTPPPDTEETLADRGDSTATAEEDPDDDDFDDESLRRRRPVTTKTRMAFNRLVTRYANATSDKSFVEKLGPVLAVTNAAILNHLLPQLLTRRIVDPAKALNAQIVAWQLLWGRAGEPGLLDQLKGEELKQVLRVLEENRTRITTLRALSQDVDYVDYDMSPELRAEFRGFAARLIVDPTFALAAPLIRKAAPHPDQASALLLNLEILAGEPTRQDIANSVLEPLGATYHDVEWEQGVVLRTDRETGKKYEYHVETLVVTRALGHLDHDGIRGALERFAVATYLAGEVKDYWRIRFAGNARDVGYWDGALSKGLTDVNDRDQDLEEFDPTWPEWLHRLEELQTTAQHRAVSA
ncbi:UNVERIFIED_CONTAM: hypothetical protein DES50_108210 [Williamsia faeni]